MMQPHYRYENYGRKSNIFVVIVAIFNLVIMGIIMTDIRDTKVEKEDVEIRSCNFGGRECTQVIIPQSQLQVWELGPIDGCDIVQGPGFAVARNKNGCVANAVCDEFTSIFSDALGGSK